MDRRGFLKGVIASGAAPMLFNGCATGFFANSRVNVAVVGYGRIAHTMDVPGVLRLSDRCVVTAICDVDARRAEYGKSVVERHYFGEGERREDGAAGESPNYRKAVPAPDIEGTMAMLRDLAEQGGFVPPNLADFVRGSLNSDGDDTHPSAAEVMAWMTPFSEN